MLRSAYPQAQGSIGRSGTDLEEQSGASRKRSCCKCVAVRISDASNLALYLAPSLPKENVQRCLEDTLTDCGEACRRLLLIVAKDFNADFSGGVGEWLVDYIRYMHSVKCVLVERKLPTTIREACIDLAFDNFDAECLQEPLSMHFSDHKAVVVKAKRMPALVRNPCSL
ncbi:hypothetical protein HPB51_013536 [Rhipicephalus microplus]|uniref:Uncharacterized protein n=1 Tax=Rhipicephalus microplus TaxID=6941 RepID=A0A9J6EA12_RHIMP|nr:hypothetical protein HPB51_013536 [Rhipicephalus microplus]